DLRAAASVATLFDRHVPRHRTGQTCPSPRNLPLPLFRESEPRRAEVGHERRQTGSVQRSTTPSQQYLRRSEPPSHLWLHRLPALREGPDGARIDRRDRGAPTGTSSASGASRESTSAILVGGAAGTNMPRAP